MKKHIFLFIALSAFIFSCASTKNASANAPTNTSSSSFKDIAPGDSLFASIEKGFCFGTCPVYEMHIYNSGLVVLNAKHNLEMSGIYHSQLSEQQMNGFIEKAQGINYFSMKENYDNEYVTDLPETITSIVIDGKRKRVRRRYDFPKEIVAFEEKFSSLLETLS